MKRGYEDAFDLEFSSAINDFKKSRFGNNNDHQFLLPPLSALITSLHEPQLAPIMRHYQQGPPVDPFRKNMPVRMNSEQPSLHNLQNAYYPRAPVTPPSAVSYSKLEGSEIITHQAAPYYQPSFLKNQPQTIMGQLEVSRNAFVRTQLMPRPSEADSSSEDDVDDTVDASFIPTVENPSFNYQQLQPIRILAYQVGLSRDPNKSWRYRDIKRALFEKCSKDQLALVDSDSSHTLLRQRLPHKLSLAQFCKRLLLLVFHFIIRDGREPKFWRKKTVRQDLVKKILRECEPEFYKCVNIKVAVLLHSYVAAGMTLQDALTKIKDEDNMGAD